MWNGINSDITVSLISGFALVTLVHACGFVLLYRIKFNPVNQRTILLNLAFSELGIGLTLTVVYLFVLTKNCNQDCYLTDIFFAQLFTVTNKLVVIYLICDRVLEVQLNIKYPLYFSASNVQKIIMTLWFITGGYSLTLVMLVKLKWSTNKTIETVMTSVMVAEDTIIIVTSVITYIILYQKVRNITSEEQREKTVQHDSRKMKSSKFMLPSLIITSYIIFNLAGDIMFFYNLTLKKDDRLNAVTRLFWILGWLADGVLYVFLQKSIRNRLFAFFRRGSSRVSTEVLTSSN